MNANKKIVIFAWAESVHTQRWVKGMTGRGYDIKLISLGGKEIDGINSYIIPRQSKMSYLLKASEAVDQAVAFNPDLIHTHYPTGFGLWAIKLDYMPSLISVWGADVIDFPNTMFKKYYLRKVLHSADKISATSKFLKDRTVTLYPELEEKISVIPFGVNIPKESSTYTTEGPFKLCFIKGHRKKYGPDILLKSLAIAKEKVQDIKLSIAGEGEMTEELKSMVENLNLSDNVEFVGFIDNQKINDFISVHHAMVMPSVMDSESFGVAVIEASASGRAVIASDIGGVPEVMRHNETGLLVPPGDIDKLAEAIVELALDSKKCVTMGENGFKFVSENYDWEKSLDSMAELYDKIIYDRKK